MNNFTTPILFLIFNRPETTRKVFKQIRELKPAKLYVAADGPREDIDGEDIRCIETRQFVFENIDWDCQVFTLLRDKNYGCGVAPSSAISWFFENEEEGIILEDDCLPSISFFTYAAYCLNKYRDSLEVMHIGGNNFLNKSWGNHTYFYSAYNHVWGWATWRRAWKLYNYDLNSFNVKKLSKALNRYFPDDVSIGWLNFYKSLQSQYNKQAQLKCDFWDYQWSFSIWLNKGICIYPNINLVSNIGFGAGATHTFDVTSKFNNLPYHELSEVTSPPIMLLNKDADILTSEVVFSMQHQPFISKLINNLGSFSLAASKELKKVTKLFIPKVLRVKMSRAKQLMKNKTIAAKTIEQLELERISNVPRYTFGFSSLPNNKFQFVDSASFVFMYDEIFCKQIYAFVGREEKQFIIDCGANIGLSVLYFKSLYPEAEILAFEPDPKIFQVLNENTKLLNNVLLKEIAVWHEETKIEFYSEGADGGSLTKTTVNVDKIEVLTERLSGYITKRVDFLKIDIEGAELAVLVECEEKLDLVQHIFIEFHSFINRKQELSILLNVLEKNNFRYHINNPGLSSVQPFINLNSYNGMDMQLNIYAFR